MSSGNIVSNEGEKPKIRYTLKTTMTITIRSRMTMPIIEEDTYPEKPMTKEFQKKLHEAIAWAIFNNVEWARDDTDRFDRTALDHTDISVDGIDEPEISDYAEIDLEYRHGKTTWQDERVPTKAERNEGIVSIQSKEQGR